VQAALKVKREQKE